MIADDLTGMALPKVALPSTGGGFADPSAFEGLAALIILDRRHIDPPGGDATAVLKWPVNA